MATKSNGFKQMPKMETDEPSVILKLKKGGRVGRKHVKTSEVSTHHEHHGMHHFAKGGEVECEAPKKPSMAERRRAMNPALKKGGKAEHKAVGGLAGAVPPAVQQALAQRALAQRAMAARAALAARGAAPGSLPGGAPAMKKGGKLSAEKVERELKAHEKAKDSAHGGKAHAKHGGKIRKADGGEIDSFGARSAIENDEGPFVRTKVVDGDKADRAHGTGEVRERNEGGYKRGGKVKHHKADGGTIEGNEGRFERTLMVDADHEDRVHGTGEVGERNAGGYRHGGKAEHHKRHKATGGAIEGNEMRFAENNVEGTPRGKTNGRTGEVGERNAGGYKHGGHAAKKAYAKGGSVNDEGKAEKMPHHFVSAPVANTMQSGTFKRGGKVKAEQHGAMKKLLGMGR